MTKSRRIFALIVGPLVLALLWLMYGSGGFSSRADAEQPAGGDATVTSHLEQAAASIVTAAKQGAHSAQSDEEIVRRADLSLEALRIIGLLGDVDTDAKAGKLLDDLQAGASPPVIEAIIQMRVARQLRQWSRLDAAQRKQAIDRFVSDIKDQGLTPAHVDLLSRITDILEQSNQNQLAADAIRQLIPLFRASKEPVIQRRAPVMEGVVRRLELVGKPLELDGKMLDGSKLDWASYRGKVVLVDFFANWCQVCREEVPNVLNNYRAYREKGFEVVGVSLDEQRGLAESYAKQTGFRFPTLFSDDPNATGWDHPMARKYGVTGLPRAILIDENGIVVETVARGPRLGQHLRELLGPPGGSVDGRVGEFSAEPGDGLEYESGAIVPAAFEEVSEPSPGADDSPAPVVPEE